MSDFTLVVTTDKNAGYDVTELVEQVKWKGRKGAAARSLTVTLVNDGEGNRQRVGIDVTKGCHCLFTHKGAELFRGIIMSTSDSQKKKMSFVAYDNGIYLANNDDTWVYESKTASYIFSDVCTRFGIPTGTIANLSYVIPDLTAPKTSGFDVILDALSLEYDYTGRRHFIMSNKGALSLVERRDNILQWVIETAQNMISYTLTNSIENIKTRLKITSDENKTIATVKNEALESKIGIFQEIDTIDETLTDAQINDIVASMFKELSSPSRKLSVEALGIPEVISGVGVYVIINDLGISQTFYVDSDTHIFQGDYHRMSVELTCANDL